MGVITYSAELPNKQGEFEEVFFDVHYDTETTDDGTAHDCIAPQRWSEHTVSGFWHEDEQIKAMIELLYQEGGNFAININEYVQANGEQE